MATATERIAAIDALIDTIIAGGGLKRYGMSGDEMDMHSIPELLEARRELVPLALAEQGKSAFSFARLQPR